MVYTLLLLLSLAAPLHADKFYPLFTENTLSGWDASGAAEWTMKNGVLTVRLPKKKETIRQEQRKNARRIAVKG